MHAAAVVRFFISHSFILEGIKKGGQGDYDRLPLNVEKRAMQIFCAQKI